MLGEEGRGVEKPDEHKLRQAIDPLDTQIKMVEEQNFSGVGAEGVNPFYKRIWFFLYSMRVFDVSQHESICPFRVVSFFS